MQNNFISLSPDVFKEVISKKGCVVIDVRTPGEITEGKIVEDALEIDFFSADFKNKLDKLDKSQKYLIYCKSSGRTGQAMRIMKDMEFEFVCDLAGGKCAWDREN
jgi:rhodanese-related sulfurtransferase